MLGRLNTQLKDWWFCNRLSLPRQYHLGLQLLRDSAVDGLLIQPHTLKSPYTCETLVEPRRYLRCLGQPALFAANGEPIRFRTRKHLALLIYLAVDHKSHRREHLAELLWPKVSLTEARHSLATALSTLRPRLGPGGLESSRDQVRLTPGRVDLDLDRLEAGDVLGSVVTGPLDVGGFLDGFDIADSSEFTHWKDRQQARFLPMIKDALVVLIDRCRRTGDSRQIEQLADRMLALDELSEEAIRAKMEARALAGDRLTALEFFEEWRTKLAEELHAVPSDLVEGMAIRLRRRGWERTNLTNIPTVPTDQWRGRPFIGRTAEYRVIYEAWESVQRGEPGHVLMLGDSGVGKTTLGERFATAAGLEGAAISRVQCYDLEREIPYSTVSSLILGLLDRPGVSATAPEALAELARTIPAVRHRFPAIPQLDDCQGEAARIRFTEAMHEMLTTIAEEHPVVLVVDDLHYADEVSLAVLHLLVRRARKQSIMLLLLARPGELSRSPQAACLQTTAGILGIREIEVPPLGEAESLELLKSLLPTQEPHPSGTVQRALLQAGGGYPMVLELLVQDWQDSGEQSLALSVDAMTAVPGEGGQARIAYRQLLDRLTRSLDTTTYNVLNLASLLGQRLNDLTLFALVDLSLGQTVRAMAELVRRRVLRDGASGLEFVNEMVRAAAYVGVPVALRKILHGKIADRFIQEHHRGEESLGLEIAWHCIRAGRSAEATPYLLDGSRRAIRSGVPYAAERGLSTALPSLADSDRSEGLVLLAEALQEQSRWSESLEYLDEATLRPDSHSADLAFVLRTKARRRLGHIEGADLTELPATLLAFMESSQDTTSRIKGAVEAASVLDTISHTHLTPRLLKALSSLANENLTLDDMTHLLLARSMLLYNLKDFTSSWKCIEEATALLESRNAPSSVLAMLQNGAGVILAKQGAYAASIPILQQSFQTAVRTGSDTMCVQASANLALGFTRLGEYENALKYSAQALTCTVAGMTQQYHLSALRSAVISYAMLGRITKADEVIRRGSSEFADVRSPAVRQAWALYAADGYALLGRWQEALSEGWRGTAEENSEVHSNFHVGPYARWIARSSASRDNSKSGMERLGALLQNLNTYDAIDRAEIVNATTWLACREGTGCMQQVEEMRVHLRCLPTAVESQLRCMGMMEADWDG